MSENLWEQPAKALLEQTASADPTPGGGSIAAMSGAFGFALLRMAVAVTKSEALNDIDWQLSELLEATQQAANDDVVSFTSLMAAYRLPRATDDERSARTAAIAGASEHATAEPLRLAEMLKTGIALSRTLEASVKPGILSDVLAGRDLLIGAAWAAIRTADINLTQLHTLDHPQAEYFRSLRTRIAHELEGAR